MSGSPSTWQPHVDALLQIVMPERVARVRKPFAVCSLMLLSVAACGGSENGAPGSSAVPQSASITDATTTPTSSASGSVSGLAVNARVELPPSTCVMLHLPNEVDPNQDVWAVEYPDGSTGSDFSSAAAAAVVQRCFFDDGQAPTDETALLLAERYFWLGAALRIVSDDAGSASLFEGTGLSFVAPSVEPIEGGYVATFFATEVELLSLLWVRVEVTPDYVEYSVQRSRYGEFASSDDSYERPRESAPPGIDESELLSPPEKIRY